MALKSSVKNSRKPLTLNQKLEMIKLHGEGKFNAEIRRRLGLARQIVSFKKFKFPAQKAVGKTAKLTLGYTNKCGVMFPSLLQDVRPFIFCVNKSIT